MGRVWDATIGKVKRSFLFSIGKEIRMIDWDLRRLHLLRELSVRGTLSQVAEALHQSPSSVSQQLAQLERETGVTLLRKAGRGVQLTAAAHVLVEHADAIVGRLEQAEADLTALRDEVAGTIRVAVFQSVALAFLPQALADLAARHPMLRTTLTQRVPEQALHELSLREFDLVVAEQYPDHAAPRYDGLDRVPLTADRLRLAVPPSWTHVRSLEDAAGAPWAMEPVSAASRHWATQQCRRAGFEPEVRYETDDVEAHVALAESGNAVALLSDLMRVRHRPSVRLVDLPGSPRREVFTSARTALAGTPAIRAWRAALARVVPARLDLGD
jgi:DNA-binding transcriptional LysR family regulator